MTNHLLLTTIKNHHKTRGRPAENYLPARSQCLEKYASEREKYSLFFYTEAMSTQMFGILYHNGGSNALKIWEPGNCIPIELLQSQQMARMLKDYPKLLSSIANLLEANTFSDLLHIVGNGLPTPFYAYGRSHYGEAWRPINKDKLPRELFHYRELKESMLTPAATEPAGMDIF